MPSKRISITSPGLFSSSSSDFDIDHVIDDYHRTRQSASPYFGCTLTVFNQKKVGSLTSKAAHVQKDLSYSTISGVPAFVRQAPLRSRSGTARQFLNRRIQSFVLEAAPRSYDNMLLSSASVTTEFRTMQSLTFDTITSEPRVRFLRMHTAYKGPPSTFCVLESLVDISRLTSRMQHLAALPFWNLSVEMLPSRVNYRRRLVLSRNTHTTTTNTTPTFSSLAASHFESQSFFVSKFAFKRTYKRAPKHTRFVVPREFGKIAIYCHRRRFYNGKGLLIHPDCCIIAVPNSRCEHIVFTPTRPPDIGQPPCPVSPNMMRSTTARNLDLETNPTPQEAVSALGQDSKPNEPKELIPSRFAEMYKESEATFTTFSGALCSSLVEHLGSVLPILKNLVDALSATITSNVLSIISSLVVIFNEEVRSRLTTCMIYSSLAVNVLCLVKQLKAFFEVNGIDFFHKEAASAFKACFFESDPSQVSPNSFSDNFSSAGTWIKRALFGIISLLVSGLTAFGIVGQKKMHSFVQTMTDINSADKFAGSVIDRLAGLFSDLDTDNETTTSLQLKNLLDEVSFLMSQPATYFMTTEDSIPRLRFLTTHITDVLNKLPRNPDNVNRVKALTQALLFQINPLNNRLLEIELLEVEPVRIDPFPVLFTGRRNIGKTRVCADIAKWLAQELEVRPDIYSLDLVPNSKHYNTYKKQRFAIKDEFLFNKTDDHILKCFNTLFSQNPHNLPAAAITEKKQYVNFNCVFLTSNIKTKSEVPDVPIKFIEGSVDAIWGRILWFECEDPLAGDRNDGSLNLHRRADYSHMTFYYREHGKGATFGRRIECDYNDLLQTFKFMCLTREIEYLNRLVELSPKLKPEHVASINARRKLLEDKLVTATNPVFDMLRAVQPLHPEEYTQNANGNSFFVVRLQGPTDSGKTTISETLEAELSLLYGMNVIRAKRLPDGTIDIPSDKLPSIYVWDDVLFEEDYPVYISWINSIAPGSIVILCTNHQLKRGTSMLRRIGKSFVHTAIDYVSPRFKGIEPASNYYTYDLKEGSAAMIRRCGITGLAYDGKQFHSLPETGGVIADVAYGAEILVNGSLPTTQTELLEVIHDAYEKYKLKLKTLVECDAPYAGPCNFDLTIRGPKIGDIMEMISSHSNVTAGFLGSFVSSTGGACSISVSQGLIEAMPGRLNISDWVVSTSGHNLDQIATRMLMNIRRIKSDVTVHVESEDYYFTYVNGTVYKRPAVLTYGLQPRPHVLAYMGIQGNHKDFLFTDGQSTFPVTDLECAKAYFNIEPIVGMTARNLLHLKNAITTNRKLPAFQKLDSALMMYEGQVDLPIRKLQVYNMWKEHRGTVIVGGIILSLLGAFSLYKLIKYFLSESKSTELVSNKKGKVYPNAFPSYAQYLKYREYQDMLDRADEAEYKWLRQTYGQDRLFQSADVGGGDYGEHMSRRSRMRMEQDMKLQQEEEDLDNYLAEKGLRVAKRADKELHKVIHYDQDVEDEEYGDDEPEYAPYNKFRPNSKQDKLAKYLRKKVSTLSAELPVTANSSKAGSSDEAINYFVENWMRDSLILAYVKNYYTPLVDILYRLWMVEREVDYGIQLGLSAHNTQFLVKGLEDGTISDKYKDSVLHDLNDTERLIKSAEAQGKRERELLRDAMVEARNRNDFKAVAKLQQQVKPNTMIKATCLSCSKYFNVDLLKNNTMRCNTCLDKTHQAVASQYMTFAHEGLPDDGQRHKHSHLCDRCKKPFSHVHALHKNDTRPQLCKSCTRTQVKPNSVRTLKPIANKELPYEMLAKLIEPNIVQLQCGVDSCYGIGLRDRLILTVSHLVPHENAIVYVNSDTHVKVPARVVVIHRSRDVAVLEMLDNKVPSFRNIVRHFVMESDLPDVSDCCMVRYEGDTLMFNNGTGDVHIEPFPLYQSHDPMYQLEEKYVVYYPLAFQATKILIKAGDCGLPLFVYTNRGPRILGIHNGIAEDRALFSFLTTGDMEAYASPVKSNALVKAIKTSEEEQTSMNDYAELIIHPDTGEKVIVDKFLYLEAVKGRGNNNGLESPGLLIHGFNPKFKSPVNEKSHLIFLGDENLRLKNLSLPAAMTAAQVEDKSRLFYNEKLKQHEVLWSQIMLYGADNSFKPDQSAFEWTKEYLREYYQTTYGKLRFLTEYEMLNGYRQGHPLYGALHGIRLDTSAGILYKSAFQANKKSDLLTNHAKLGQPPVLNYARNGPGQKLKQQVELHWHSISQGIPKFSGAKACRKVELLPKEKVQIGKTRAFVALDTDAVIIQRKLYGNLLAACIKNRRNAASQIGINPIKEFTDIALKFASFFGIRTDIDYSRYDKTVVKLFRLMFAEIVASMHEIPENLKTQKDIDEYLDYVLACYRAEAQGAAHPLTTCDGVFFQAMRGVFSGELITQMLDDFVNHFNTVYALRCKFRILFNKVPTFTEMRNLYVLFTLGDDNANKTHPKLQMTFEDFVKYGKELGLDVTPADKLATSGGDTNMFLSRTLDLDERYNIVYPALKKSAILHCLHYVAAIDTEQVCNNFRTVLFEAAMHDQRFYDDCAHDIRIQLSKMPNVGEKVLKTIKIVDYKTQRNLITRYIKYGDVFPDFSYQGTDGATVLELPSQETITPNSLNKLNKSFSDVLKTAKPQIMTNPISWMNEWWMEHPDEERPCETSQPPSAWTYTIEGHLKLCGCDYKYTGHGSSKSLAKQQAYHELVEFIQHHDCPRLLLSRSVTPQGKPRFGRRNRRVDPPISIAEKTVMDYYAQQPFKRTLPKLELDPTDATKMYATGVIEYVYVSTVGPRIRDSVVLRTQLTYDTGYPNMLPIWHMSSWWHEYARLLKELAKFPAANESRKPWNTSFEWQVDSMKVEYDPDIKTDFDWDTQKFWTHVRVTEDPDNTFNGTGDTPQESREDAFAGILCYAQQTGHYRNHYRELATSSLDLSEKAASEHLSGAEPQGKPQTNLDFPLPTEFIEEIDIPVHPNTYELFKHLEEHSYDFFMKRPKAYQFTIKMDSPELPPAEGGQVLYNMKMKHEMDEEELMMLLEDIENFETPFSFHYNSTRQVLIAKRANPELKPRRTTPLKKVHIRNVQKLTGNTVYTYNTLSKDLKATKTYFERGYPTQEEYDHLMENVQPVFNPSVWVSRRGIGTVDAELIMDEVDDVKYIMSRNVQRQTLGENSGPAQPIQPSNPQGSPSGGGQMTEYGGNNAINAAVGSVDRANVAQILATSDMSAQDAPITMGMGPPNMATFNQQVRSITDMAYSMIHATTITIASGQSSGSIHAVIPYAVDNNPYLQPYASQWCKSHLRYTGAIDYELEISAVPMLRGSLKVGIMRNAPPATVTSLPIAHLERIKWVSMAVDGTASHRFRLQDARQNLFFRNVADDTVADFVNRPALVVCIFTPIINQFPEGDAQVVVHVRSRLVPPTESQLDGFFAFEPAMLPSGTVFGNNAFTGVSFPTIGNRDVDDVINAVFDQVYYVSVDGNQAFNPNRFFNQLQLGNSRSEFIVPQEILAGTLRARSRYDDPNRTFSMGATFSRDVDHYSHFLTVSSHPRYSSLKFHGVAIEAFQIMRSLLDNKCGFIDIDTTYPEGGNTQTTVYSISKNTTAYSLDDYFQFYTLNPMIASRELQILNSWKHVTNKGVFITFEFSTKIEVGNEPMYFMPKISTSEIDPEDNDLVSTVFPYPNNDFTVVKQGTDILPPGWHNLVLSPRAPSFVGTSAIGAMSELTSTDIISVLHREADRRGIAKSSGQYLQFDLEDKISGQRVLTARYLPLSQQVVVNFTPRIVKHFTCPYYLGFLRFGTISTVLGTAGFPQTDISTWLPRTTTSFDVLPTLRKFEELSVLDVLGAGVRSQAMMAGMVASGALAGIGQGLGTYLSSQNQFNQNKQLMSMKFSNQQALMTQKFGQEQTMRSLMAPSNIMRQASPNTNLQWGGPTADSSWNPT